MSDEKEQFGERTITLKVTKTRGDQPQTESEDGGSCGPWFIEIRGGVTYTCRWCATGPPTNIPYKECIGLPE